MFMWSACHQVAFKELKNAMSKSPILGFRLVDSLFYLFLTRMLLMLQLGRSSCRFKMVRKDPFHSLYDKERAISPCQIH